jgi:hypothetical protein
MLPDLLYGANLWHIARQKVELYPWMTGKPCLHPWRFVNAEVVKDDVNVLCWVMANDVLRKLDEFNSSFSVKNEIHTCTLTDVHRPEYALLRIRAGFGTASTCRAALHGS